MRIGTSKECIKRLVENNDKKFILKLWKSLGEESFIGGYPLGRSYIDSRASGSLIEYFYLYLDKAVAEKYPKLAGKYKRDIN